MRRNKCETCSGNAVTYEIGDLSSEFVNCTCFPEWSSDIVAPLTVGENVVPLTIDGNVAPLTIGVLHPVDGIAQTKSDYSNPFEHINPKDYSEEFLKYYRNFNNPFGFRLDNDESDKNGTETEAVPENDCEPVLSDSEMKYVENMNR